MTNSNFPNRPDSPEFWAMAAAMTDNDTMGDNGSTLDQIMADLGINDMQAIMYASSQRVLRALRHDFISSETAAVIGSLWVDGLAVGLRMAKNEKDKQETL